MEHYKEIDERDIERLRAILSRPRMYGLESFEGVVYFIAGYALGRHPFATPYLLTFGSFFSYLHERLGVSNFEGIITSFPGKSMIEACNEILKLLNEWESKSQ